MTDSASSPEERSAAYPQRFWWLKRIVAATMIVALLLLVLQLWWGRSAETRLRAVMAQRRASGDPASPEDLSGAELKDSDNAAFYLQRAASKLSTRFDCPSDSNNITWNDAIFPYPPKWFAIEEAAAAADQAAFADLREARKHPRANWGHLHAPLTRISLPYLSRTRWLTNNACDDAMLLHFKGRDAEALEMIVDVLALADAVDQGPFVVSHLVADGIRADATKHIQLIAPELRTDGSASATNREQVEQIIARMLDSSFRAKSAPRTFATQRVAKADLALASAQNEVLLRPMFMLEAAWVLDAPNLSAQVSQYSNLPSARRALSMSAPAWNPAHVSIAPGRILLRPEIDFRIEEEFRAAAVSLAVRLYRSDHHDVLPAKLDDLVPKYLASVPIDPLAAGNQPLGYVVLDDGRRAVVYSVGDDEIDDTQAGLPIPKRPFYGWVTGTKDQYHDLLRWMPAPTTRASGKTVNHQIDVTDHPDDSAE